MTNPILVTGAAGRTGGIGRSVAELLLKQGKAVRAMVRNEDARAQALHDMGAEIVVGNLLDLDAMHRAIAGPRTTEHAGFRQEECSDLHRVGKSSVIVYNAGGLYEHYSAERH